MGTSSSHRSPCATGWPRWSARANVVMVLAMSGEPNQNAEPKDASASHASQAGAGNGADGELPVEVVPPERAGLNGRDGAPGDGQAGQAQVIGVSEKDAPAPRIAAPREE